MSEENLEILRRGYEAVNGRDFATLRELSADDFEVHSIFLPGRVLRGPDAHERLMEEIGEGLEDYTQELEQVIDAGDQVVALVRLTGIGKESGVEVAQRYATVWTFCDGKVVKGVSYTDRAEALRSVGLSE